MIITTAAAYCLALNVYFEGRGEDYDGQKIISEVVMERLNTDGFPKTVCEVVWQPHAFSWTSDGKSDRPKDTVAWLQAQIIANETLLYGCELCTGATHYHAVGMDPKPSWTKDMQRLGWWGGHLFYKEKGCDE